MQGLDERSGLGLGAVEHGEVGEREIVALGLGGATAVDGKEAVAAQRLLQGLHDELGLGLLARGFVEGDAVGGVVEHRDRRSRGGRRGDDLRRQGYDVGVGAVVAAEPHHPGAGEVLNEFREEPPVGAPEAVDGLVRVADGADVAVGRRNLPDEPNLLLVHVLVLVDADPRILLPRVVADRGVGFQGVRGADDEVVEVAPVARLHLAPVGLPRLRELLVRERRAGPLALGDGRQAGAGLPLGDPQRILQQPQPLVLGCNPETPLQARGVPVLPEDGEAQGMEGMQRDVGPRVRQQRPQAAPQLVGGPAGEGDGQTAGRRHFMVRGQVGKPVGQGPGLSRARPRDDEQRTVGDLRGHALIGVQPGQEIPAAGREVPRERELVC